MANVKEYKKWEGSVKKMHKGSKTQVLGRVFRRVFKPWTIPWPILTVVIPLVAVLVALFSQYVVFIPLKGASAVPWLILTGLIIGVPLTYKFRAKRIRGITLGAMIVIGLFLVPYFSFFLGKMHFFAVDQMPEGFTVKEMRITMDKVAFVKSDNTEVTAWSGTEFILRPGVVTKVYLGTWDIPAGTYIGRRIYMANVSIDIEADISKLKDENDKPIPADYYQEAYANIQADFDSETGHFKTAFPNGSTSNWSEQLVDGSKFTFTMSTGPFPQPEFEAEQMDYPGFGGPDVTLDFAVDANGTVTVTPILDFPPGMGPPAGTTGGPPS